ncbi:MAG TPA: TonB family protein [Stellaceae bacterium]|jgi:protein TonB|nr:TonB family protein [Stellaceae bacterium]
MSVADGMPPAIVLPADPGFRESLDREESSKHLRRGAIAAALLAHALVIAAMLVQWPDLFPAKPLERPPIPVTLVQEVPPPPPPEVKPAPAPPPPSQSFKERVSGDDTKTTAPPPDADKGEDSAPKPTPPPPSDVQTTAAAPESKPTPPQEEKSKQEKPKLAKRETTPKPAQKTIFANREMGEKEREGDPYLNQLQVIIEQHRTYPRNAIGPLGLPLEGIGSYVVTISGDGRILGMQVARSAGAEVLDQAALKMISSAAPFPRPPSDYPLPISIYMTLPIYPGPS